MLIDHDICKFMHASALTSSLPTCQRQWQ